jgi:HK97 gp10 family phage protein
MLVVNNFGRANTWLKNASEEALNQLGYFLVGEAKKRCPVDEGTLRGAIQHRVIEGLRGKTLQLYNNMSYAIPVHEGTRRKAPRRFMTDAVNENQARIIAVAQMAYRGGLR